MGFLADIVSNLIAGLVGTGILSALALAIHALGPERAQRWIARWRQFGWASLALLFLVSTVVSTFVQGFSAPRMAVLAGTMAPVALIFAVQRLAPRRFQAMEAAIGQHPWQILAAVFFVTTLAQVAMPAKASSPEQIVFVVDLADEELIALRQVLTELEPQLGAKVFLMNVNSDRYLARLDKMVAEDNMNWDLIAADNNMLGVLGAKCLVEELTQYSPREKLMPNQLIPSLRGLYTSKGSGRILFAPFRPNVKVAFYNERKFNEYGVSPPRSWYELEQVARTFKEKEGVGRVAIQGHPGKPTSVTVFEFVKAAGGEPLTLADERSREAFAYLQRLEPYLAPEYKEAQFDTANELLIDDHVYLVENWTYGIKVVVEDAEKHEIKVYSGWSGPDREGHVLGGDVLAIPKGAPNADKAAKLIELLVSREVQQKLFQRIRWLPIRLDAYQGLPPDVQRFFDEGVLDAISKAELRPTDPRWTLAEKELDRAFGGLIREQGELTSLGKYSSTLESMPTEFMRYRVQKGDTLEVIAQTYGTTIEVLAEANGLTPGTSIGLGQMLLVPGREVTSCS